ncbi:hypothetical protein RJ640_009993 [Escallonia rubra]|uniref:WAT1-related protein n=1 Tax=Escallonia rubra TaxID=112253 RepID=A0AA88S3J4_9ASTE|nr:hypothetical protein RJ640_009993 [Escallonia rubra]
MDGKKPYLAVILIRSIYAGMGLLSKASFDAGMNSFVFVFYRQAAATNFLVPLAILFEWKTAPSLPFTTICKAFLLSFCGITLTLNLSGVAVTHTSATLAAAIINCLPVIIFFLAVLFRTRAFVASFLHMGAFEPVARMEEVKLTTTPGLAKVAGSSYEKLPFEASLYNSSVLFKLHSVINHCHCSGKRPLPLEAGMECQPPCHSLLVAGGTLLVGALFSVLWGKSEEKKIADRMLLAGQAEKGCSDSEAMTIKSPPPVPL